MKYRSGYAGQGERKSGILQDAGVGWDFQQHQGQQ
jgi:hypothetical protein